MRLARRERTAPGRAAAGRPRASPYRVPGEPVLGTGRRRERPIEPGVIGVLVAVLACSLMRFGLFVGRGEQHGSDGVLALAASAVSAYYLSRLLRG